MKASAAAYAVVSSSLLLLISHEEVAVFAFTSPSLSKRHSSALDPFFGRREDEVGRGNGFSLSMAQEENLPPQMMVPNEQQQEEATSISSLPGGVGVRVVSSSSPSSQRTAPRPRFLPDTEDSSMRNVLSYVENSQQDLYFSLTSDLFFLAGGVAYIALSVGSAMMGEDPGKQQLWYAVLSWLAPIVYFMNSLVDLKWALQVKERTVLKKEMVDSWAYCRRVLLDEEDSLQERVRELTVDFRDSPRIFCSDDNHIISNVCASLLSPVYSLWTRIRKHAAHRRTVLAALTFGIAAFLAVMALVDVKGSGDVCNKLSVHVYILSAVVACSGKRTRPWLVMTTAYTSPRYVPHGLAYRFLSNPEMLEDLGDLLFLIGSLVDGILSDEHFDDNNPGWSILSACLWFMDACLYLRSDVIMLAQQRVRSLNEDGGSSSENGGSGALV